MREDTVPKKAEKISNQYSARAWTTWARTRRTGQDGWDEGGSAEQSERFSEQDRRNYVIMIVELILILCFFFQENKSHGV